MTSINRPARSLLLLAAGLAGCGGDPETTPAVPAAGTITYKGKPLEEGTLQFVPEKGRAASAQVVSGRFVLTTYEPLDGAVPGKHSVGIVAMKALPARPGAEPEMVPAIDPKYSSPGSSGVVVDVPAAGKSDIVIELK